MVPLNLIRPLDALTDEPFDDTLRAPRVLLLPWVVFGVQPVGSGSFTTRRVFQTIGT